MAPGKDQADDTPAVPGQAAVRAIGIGATALAAALAVVLAVRPVSSYDIGYHLAYGEHFLDTGQIVQTNRFIYTRFRQDILTDPDQMGPGCRYDPETNTYSFINANWLTQVVIAAVHRAGGMGGLVALSVSLVAGIFALLIVIMRRGRVGWPWIAAAIVLASVASYERFVLRPELFGYVLLVGQLALLVGPGFTWRRAAAVVALQVLAVNVHSYFLLGVAVTGAMFGQAVLRQIWARAVAGQESPAAAAEMKWYGLAVAGVALACLCNPWHVRGAIMPVQTLMFIRKHEIAGLTGSAGRVHPWAVIGELVSPFADYLSATKATDGYYGVLALASASVLVAALCGRWGWLAIIVVMTASSLKMRRNMALTAMTVAPLSMVVLAFGWARLRERLAARADPKGSVPGPKAAGRIFQWGSAAVGISAGLLAAWWIVGVVSQRFYLSERRSWRFGVGLSRYTVPLDAAEWINAHQPAGRIFCEHDTSSNLMYFTKPRRQVPILTNTWASPPYVISWVFGIAEGVVPFEPVVAEYDVGMVVLRYTPLTRAMIRRLTGDRGWAVVSVGIQHVAFLRRDGPNAALADAHAVTRENFDVEALVRRLKAADPAPAFSGHTTALLLLEMGWGNRAIDVWNRCLEIPPVHHDAKARLAMALAQRGTARMVQMRDCLKQRDLEGAARRHEQILADWSRAAELLDECIERDPDNPGYRHNRQLLRQQQSDLRRRRFRFPQGAQSWTELFP